MITITLRQILDAGPCYDPRDNGLLPADHGFDAPIGFREIAAKVSAAAYGAAACAVMDAARDAACATSAASASESAWQAERLIQLTDAGTWSPAGE